MAPARGCERTTLACRSVGPHSLFWRPSGLSTVISGVITVALNPSNREFPEPAPFSRFKKCAGSRVPVLKDYISALNSSFRVSPYRSWFDSYEQALNGVGASYYGGAKATALHTDIASCLATTPTWSRLSEAVRQRLRPDGISLWHNLVTYLATTDSPVVHSTSLARANRIRAHG